MYVNNCNPKSVDGVKKARGDNLSIEFCREKLSSF